MLTGREQARTTRRPLRALRRRLEGQGTANSWFNTDISATASGIEDVLPAAPESRWQHSSRPRMRQATAGPGPRDREIAGAFHPIGEPMKRATRIAVLATLALLAVASLAFAAPKTFEVDRVHS